MLGSKYELYTKSELVWILFIQAHLTKKSECFMNLF